MFNLQFPKETIIEKEKRKAFVSHWFKRIFIDDWVLKLTALVITMALWLGVSGLQTTERVRLRPVYLNARVPDQFEITNSIVQDVELQVVGEKRKVERLDPRDYVVSLDLANISEGERTVRLTPDNVSIDLPPGVKIERINPDRLVLKVERILERDVPVKVDVHGKTMKGYEVYGEKSAPEKIKIRGPKSLVGSINSVTTEAVSVENRNADFFVPGVAIKGVNPKVTLLTSYVDITCIVNKTRIERLFVVTYDTGERKGKASVVLYGPADLLEDLNAESIEVSEIVDENGNKKLKVELPKGTEDKVEVRSVKYRE
ncbi:MAG: YbbR-like domain-containing protein [Pyrinomonadaceae bacterium]